MSVNQETSGVGGGGSGGSTSSSAASSPMKQDQQDGVNRPRNTPVRSVSIVSTWSESGGGGGGECDAYMEAFLENARFGNYDQVNEAISRFNGGDVQHNCELAKMGGGAGAALNSSPVSDTVKNKLDINYRGKHKRFYGWSALHLSVYFNKLDIVKLLLEQPNIDINITNNENDTSLHKAVLTSKYELVELLVLKGADLNIRNNQGFRPIDLASDHSIKELLKAAEKTENFNRQKLFFDAICASDLARIKKLLDSRQVDINCSDTFGNTGLHIAASRNQCEAAVLLIERGCNTVLKNNNNLTALDLAKSREMREIIGYAPHNHCKYQGVLLKKRKFLGFKEYFVVLNKGYIIYYNNETDASNDQNRKGAYNLNNAFIKDYPNTGPQNSLAYSWTINYTDGKRHTLCALASYKKKQPKSSTTTTVNATSTSAATTTSANNTTSSSRSTDTSGNNNNTNNNPNKQATLTSRRPNQLNPSERKKKWIEAIKEHIKYSESHMESSTGTTGDTQMLVPIESLQQQLNILKKDEDKLNFLLIQIEQQLSNISPSDLNQLAVHSNLYQISTYKPNFESLKQQIKLFIEDTNKCLSLHEQRDSLLKSQLIDTRAKCELLEQSLRVLAQENLELEAKKLHHRHHPGASSTTGGATAAGVSSSAPASSPTSAKTTDSIDDDVVTSPRVTNNPSVSIVESDNSDLEEFFDIDDPLTDEELEISMREKRASLSPKQVTTTTKEAVNTTTTTSVGDSKSLALGSCYSSLTDMNNTQTSSQMTSPLAHQTSVRRETSLTLTNNNNIETDENGWRTRLPAKMIDRSQISIWSILKQSIGKELSKIAMPAALCEPLSFLQRITENVHYSYLLHKAAESTDPCRRFEYISAFAVASISANIGRLAKPFNPLLGETYECVREDLGFKCISEQVSHHPPVSAFHADSTDPKRNWRFYGTVQPKIKFWGKSVEIEPKGLVTVELPEYKEIYTFSTVTCCVHNIIVGTLWFEYYGTMEISCNRNGYKSVLNFRPYSWSNKELNKVDGYVYDNKKNKLKAMYGYWTHCFYSCDADAYDSYVKSGKKLPMAQFDKNYSVTQPLGCPQSHLLAPHYAHNFHLKSTNSSNHSDSNLGGSIIENSEKLSLSNNAAHNQTRFTLSSTTSDNGIDVFEGSTSSSSQQHNNNDVSSSGRSSSPPKKSLVDADSPQPPSRIVKHTMSVPASLNSLIKDLQELWVISPRPPHTCDYYNFSYFTMSLNELKDGMDKVLAPSDSRFRSDVRQLELGDLDGASREKNRLEEKQRESRKNRERTGDAYKGTWFYLSKHPVTNEECWLFNHKYWSRDFTKSLDIY